MENTTSGSASFQIVTPVRTPESLADLIPWWFLLNDEFHSVLIADDAKFNEFIDTYIVVDLEDGATDEVWTPEERLEVLQIASSLESFNIYRKVKAVEVTEVMA